MEKEKKYLIDNPTLMAEWNYEKNNELGLDPKTLTAGSAKKVWWKCEKGHEWLARIDHRFNGVGCPYCYGRYAVKGETDLATVNPKLAKEWNYEKNGNLLPENFKANSGKKVWWKCEKGHEWQATIASRNSRCGCPVCRAEKHTSFPEYALMFYLEKNGVAAIQSYKGNGYELDIYIPSKKIAIEYDGYYWHKKKVEKDLEKNAICQKNGIKLYRIRDNLAPLNSSSIDYIIKNVKKDLGEIIEKILCKIIGYKVDIDIERDAIKIENLREYIEKENSILSLNPILASEWNYEKNGKIKPENFKANSGKKVWWKCEKGHEWMATIAARNYGRGCPYCSGQRVLQGYNDLATLNPKLASEWDYEKNGDLKPENFTANSGRVIWWKCSKGHSYQATIYDRNKGANCPYCSHQKLLQGYSDLETVNPKLASEWNYEKNGSLKPCDVFSQSNRKVWWKCSKGHDYQATVNNRANGKGCPYCSGQKVLQGYNDLATLNPKLASEWSYDKNGSLKPEDFTAGSNKKVWWKCDKGHEWLATIASRNNGGGCPYCYGRYAVKGETDLAAVNPKLASEWNYEKNGDLKPENFTASSGQKVWWKCNKGHEWLATIASRNNGVGCPYCSGRYAIKGVSDLATLNPKLASEWNYEKNGSLKPEDFTAGSNKKVWWKCNKGHEWLATIASRNNGVGCPYCSGRKKEK